MKPVTKLVLILLAGAAAGTTIWYFTIYRPAHPKATEDEGPSTTTPPASSTGTSTIPKPNSGLGTIPSSPIGKTAYAKFDNVTVLSSAGTVYKKAKQGEWIGEVVSTKTMSGALFYVIKFSGNQVVAGVVDLK